MSKTKEDVLKEILEQSLAGYWDWDIPTGDEYLSPSFKKMFGYEDHEMENRADSWQKIIFQADLPGVYDKFNQHEESKGEIPFYNEIRYHHKNGTTVWVICTGKVIEWDENGKAKRMVGCHINITERKQAEISLQESESRFHDLFEKAPLGYQSLDIDGRFIEVNHAWLETLGYNREEVLGKWFGDFLAPEYVQAFRERFPVFKAQGHIHSEFFMLHKDGCRRYIAFDGRIGHNTNGSFKQTHCILKDETARKQAEDALRAKDALYSKMISNIGDVIVIIDRNGINRYKSPNIEKWFGWKPEEVLGCSAFDNVHPDDRERGQTFIGQLALTPNASGTTELRYRCKDGSYKWIEITIVNLLHDPAIKGFLGNYQDITERKQAEEAVLRSEENYRFQFMNMDSYNSLYEVITDKDGKPCDFRIIMVNHAYEKYVGKTAFELIGKTLLEVYPATEPYWIEEMAKVSLTGVPRHFESFSQVMNTHTEINLYVPQKGQIAMTTANIDGRKSAEEQLRESEQRFRIAMEHLPGTIWVTDKNLIFTLSQGACLDKFGLKPDQVVGMSLYDFFGTKDPSHISISSHLRCLTGETVTYEQTFNGMVFQTIINPLVGPDGEIKNVLGLAIDVTAEKKAHAEKEKMRNEVNMMQKLESLGILAGGIAHDFNNLLGGIFGYIDMASEKAKDTKVTSYLSKAGNTIERARALTGQLLTFAKGGAPIQKIDHLFPFVEETAKFALSGANVSCNFDVPQDLWACNFDKNQIGQVIDNLIINAQQAMPVGGSIELTARNITLSEREHPLLGKGNFVRIAIKDTGIGISKEFIAKIFDPFFTTKAKGHGLGLATCYSIINRHGGCIDVESEQGKGSTFKVYLPASQDSVPAAIKPIDKTHKGNGTFLIMDDEEVMRDTIGDMLESLGYEVISKVNGKDAVDCFLSETKANRQFAGMVFDLTVPGGMGGKTAIEEIRKVNRKIPAFVASGYADDPIMKNPAEYGFSASICKPFRKSELVEMLDRHLKPKK